MKWLADENFDNDILRGIRRRVAGFDVVRAQDVAEISGLDDSAVLAWATTNDRVGPTHDLSTTIPAMQEQVKRFASCSPILFVHDSLPVNLVIDEIFSWTCSISWTSARLRPPRRQALYISRSIKLMSEGKRNERRKRRQQSKSAFADRFGSTARFTPPDFLGFAGAEGISRQEWRIARAAAVSAILRASDNTPEEAAVTRTSLCDAGQQDKDLQRSPSLDLYFS